MGDFMPETAPAATTRSAMAKDTDAGSLPPCASAIIVK